MLVTVAVAAAVDDADSFANKVAVAVAGTLDVYDDIVVVVVVIVVKDPDPNENENDEQWQQQ